MYSTGEHIEYSKYPKGAKMMMLKHNALDSTGFFEGQRDKLIQNFDFKKPVAVIAIIHQGERKLQGPDVICVAIPNKRYSFNANLDYRTYPTWHGTEWLLQEIGMSQFQDEDYQHELFDEVYGAQWLPYDIFVPVVGSNQESKFILNKLEV